MMYAIGSALLVSQFGLSRADTCGAVVSDEGSVSPLDVCILGLVKYYCEGGVAYQGVFYAEDNCGGDATVVAPLDDTYTVDCDAEPCDVATLNLCADAGCSVNCTAIPLVLDTCAAGDDGDYTSSYCDSSLGLVIGTFSDSACTDVEATIPYSLYAEFLVSDDGCIDIQSDCEASDDSDDSDEDAYVDCPTGAIYAQLNGDEDAEVPYITLGLCNEYSSIGSSMYECDDDGVANYYFYLGDGCSGAVINSDVLELGDDNSSDTTTFRTACNTDVDCTFARFTVTPYDEQAGECASDDETYQQTLFVGTCVNNGTASMMISCTDTAVTRSTWASSDCSGTAVETGDMTTEFGGDERCPGEVVNCYMTEPDFANDNNSGAASKVMVGQVVLVLAMIAFLLA